MPQLSLLSTHHTQRFSTVGVFFSTIMKVSQVIIKNRIVLRVIYAPCSHR